MNKRENLPRILAIGIFYILVSLLFVGRLLYLQVSGQDYYTMSTPDVTYTRTVKIQAQRGEIFDRNGKPLVTNAYCRSLYLDYATMPSSSRDVNEMLLNLFAIAERSGESDTLLEPKSSLLLSWDDSGVTAELPDGFLETARGKRYAKLIEELSVEHGAPLGDALRALMLHYAILSREVNPETLEAEVYYNYTYEVSAELLAIRLDMDLSGFSTVQPYELARDISLSFITGVEELYTRGYTIQVSASRVYQYPGYASHILGRVNKIPSGKSDYYTERGYAYDALVGIGGAEEAFEDELRGVDGELTITEDEYGNILGSEVTLEPVAGNDVYLTIDIDMQMVAERALAENIFRIRAEGLASGKPLSGEDASVGALTALDSNTNEILAIASYPTYNLATFSEDYAALANDPLSPLYNRALNGTYAPGSTFKVGVAVAALSEELLTKDTFIDTKGIYTYYEDSGYTPRCWLYLLAGQSHGPINIVEAIQESCNYFFFDVGRRLTIETMNDYCRRYGLGQSTGVELPEATGILAGPDYRADNGLGQWSPGDTLQAAIGQSDNLFTPLQIGTYFSTILNSGTRYAAHLLYQVRAFGTGEILYQCKSEVLSRFEIKPDILATVKEGMKGVMDNGSAASVFSGYEISVGGKTGTAQVSPDKSDNGIITAFAPFEDPQIIVTCVIEQASGGTEAGYAIRDLFDYYFDVPAIRAARAAEEKAKAEAEANGYDYDTDENDYDDYE